MSTVKQMSHFISRTQFLTSVLNQFSLEKTGLKNLTFLHLAKGQVILESFFGVFNFSQKMNKTRRIVVKNKFVRFLEEFVA